MHLLREITIDGAETDADWVGDESATALADSAFLKLSPGWTDLEWVMLYADANGNVIGADSGTFNAQVTFRIRTRMGVSDGDREYKYFRGATQTGVGAGVLQLGDDQAGGRTLRGGHVEATIRLSSAITSPPAAAITAQLWAQEV